MKNKKIKLSTNDIKKFSDFFEILIKIEMIF